MATKTVKEHTDETDQMVRHLKDGDSLIVKLRDQLDEARRAFKWLEEFSHPSFCKSIQYQRVGVEGDKPATMKKVIEAQVARINATLGDAA
jgi:hypothetical protein